MSDFKEFEEIIPSEERPNVGNVYDDLKERISNPFLFSYAVAFFFTNWRVWVGLLFFDRERLNSKGFDNHLEYIEGVVNAWTLYVVPATAAILYCFAYPFLRNKVLQVQAYFKSKSSEEINKYARQHLIPAEQFINLEMGLERQKQRYQRAIDIRAKLEVKVDELNKQVSSSNFQVSNLNEQIAELNAKNSTMLKDSQTHIAEREELFQWNNLNDLENYNGDWRVQFFDSQRPDILVRIYRGEGEILDSSRNPVTNEAVFLLRSVYVNRNIDQLVFEIGFNHGQANEKLFPDDHFVLFDKIEKNGLRLLKNNEPFALWSRDSKFSSPEYR
jgi:hypothetical protein